MPTYYNRPGVDTTPYSPPPSAQPLPYTGSTPIPMYGNNQFTGYGGAVYSQLAPQQPQQPAIQNTAPQGNGRQGSYDALTDPTPYNQAIQRGNQMIGSIPSKFPYGASPALRGLSSGTQSGLNTQWGQRGADLSNQKALEFASYAGTAIPQWQLDQGLGLSGLDSRYASLANQQYGNEVYGATSSLSSLMNLLGAFI